VLFYKKSKESFYESPKFEEFVPDDIESKFKIAGKNIRGELIQQTNYIGRIGAVLWLKGKFPAIEIDKNKYNIMDDQIDYDMVAFKIVSGFFFFRWIGLFRKYVFVNKNQLETNIDARSKVKIFNLKQFVDLVPYGKNMYIGSKEAEEYISNIPIKRSNIGMLQYTADYPDRLVFLDTRHAKTVSRKKQEQEIKSKSFAEYKKAIGEDVDAEEDD
jgi:hypothetical protein